MGLTEKMAEIKSEAESLLEYANGVTGAGDVRLGDAIKTLADGFGAGGDGGGAEFTEVTSIPDGRSFSIPCDYGKCVIVLMMTSSTNLYGGIGYNGTVKNVAQGQWTNDGTGFGIIYIDNVNLRIATMGMYSASESSRRNGEAVLSERVRNIQPHWINSQTLVAGGYYVIPLS